MSPHQPELDRKPREPSHAAGVFFIGDAGRDLTKLLEKVCEPRIGVQRHAPEYVMKNVGLLEVFEVFTRPNDDGRRKSPLGNTREEISCPIASALSRNSRLPVSRSSAIRRSYNTLHTSCCSGLYDAQSTGEDHSMANIRN